MEKLPIQMSDKELREQLALGQRAMTQTNTTKAGERTQALTNKRAIGEAEISRLAEIQRASAIQWKDWNWREYQVTLVRRMHNIARLEQQRDELLAALKQCVPHPKSMLTSEQLCAVIAKAEGRAQ